MPSKRKLLTVFLPLALLALVGLFLVATAIVMLTAWGMDAFGNPIAGLHQPDTISLLGPAGGLMLLFGSLMAWPFFRRLTRRKKDDAA